MKERVTISEEMHRRLGHPDEPHTLPRWSQTEIGQRHYVDAHDFASMLDLMAARVLDESKADCLRGVAQLLRG